MQKDFKKNYLKTSLTIFGVYEVIIILLLSFKDLCVKTMCLFSEYRYCDFCEYRGFQYVLLCLLVPIIFGLLWWWRKELVELMHNIKHNKHISRFFSGLLEFFYSLLEFFYILLDFKIFNEYKENSTNSEKSEKKDNKKTSKYGWQSWE